MNNFNFAQQGPRQPAYVFRKDLSALHSDFEVDLCEGYSLWH